MYLFVLARYSRKYLVNGIILSGLVYSLHAHSIRTSEMFAVNENIVSPPTSCVYIWYDLSCANDRHMESL